MNEHLVCVQACVCVLVCLRACMRESGASSVVVLGMWSVVETAFSGIRCSLLLYICCYLIACA